MGNNLSGYDLRDRDTEKKLPKHISRITSNLILANLGGNFYPCVVLGPSSTLTDGYRVYFFHAKEETEIPGTNIIGNLRALTNCQISVTDGAGAALVGVVRASDHRCHPDGQPRNFFVSRDGGGDCLWVSFPFVHLTGEQARVLF